MMITRIWHGKTDNVRSEEYLNFLLNDGTREYLETEGNSAVKIWVKRGSAHCDFFTVTEWEDINAIIRFAGPDYDKAIYYPEDTGMLLTFEKSVKHFQTYDVSRTKIDRHLKKLTQLFDGNAWLGVSFPANLQGVDQRLAFQSPATDMHCIASLVWHCAYWKSVAIEHIKGNHTYREETVDQMNFLPLKELQAEGWDKIRENLFKTNLALMEALKTKKDHLLNQHYAPGYNYDYLIEGIIQHDAYHLGQIGVIRKLLLTGTHK